MDTVVRFLVNAKVHEVPLQQLHDFPLKDSLLNLLHEKLKNLSIGVKVTADAAIIIEQPCKYFDKVLQIYAKPTITLHELLNLDFIGRFDAENQAFRERINPKGWTDQNLIEERFIAHKLLEQNGYQILIKENFKEFKREMRFFGVYSLLEAKFTTEIDPGEIICRIKASLQSIFDRTHVDLPSYYVGANLGDYFIEMMAAIGGYMSGSFVLKHILNEDWDCNDIDIYVNESNLKGMLINNHCGGMGSAKLTNHSILGEYYTLYDARQGDYDRDQHIVNIRFLFETEYVKSLATLAAKLFGGNVEKIYTRNGLLVDNTQQTSDGIEPTINMLVSHEAYCSQPHAIAESISAVVKLKVHGINLDLVIVDVTVPYFIDKYFDFSFNKVFYDGYNITAFDWKAIKNKRCTNKMLKMVGTREVDYLSNISRIHKYTSRHFIIQPRN